MQYMLFSKSSLLLATTYPLLHIHCNNVSKSIETPQCSFAIGNFRIESHQYFLSAIVRLVFFIEESTDTLFILIGNRHKFFFPQHFFLSLFIHTTLNLDFCWFVQHSAILLVSSSPSIYCLGFYPLFLCYYATLVGK